jgi:large subunit ribosomal protein L10
LIDYTTIKQQGGADMNKAIIAEKQVVVDQITANVKASQSISIIEYRGLGVAEFEQLRKTLRGEGVELHVLKNTLVNRAVEALGYKGLGDQLTGPNAYVFSKKDAVSGPKVLAKFARRHEKLKIKGGIVEGKVVDEKEMKIVATLPNKEGMLSMLLSCLNSPVRSLACAIKAVAEKNEQN